MSNTTYDGLNDPHTGGNLVSGVYGASAATQRKAGVGAYDDANTAGMKLNAAVGYKNPHNYSYLMGLVNVLMLFVIAVAYAIGDAFVPHAFVLSIVVAVGVNILHRQLTRRT